jgi:hypothetical protein
MCRYVGPGGAAPGEQAVLVGFGRFLDAVGVEDDGAGELGQFLGLVLPGAAEVADQVGVLLQAGVAVGRQHFAVGIDVDALAFGLLEQLLEHLQVVAGNQDALAGAGAEIDLGGHRVTVVFHMTRVEQAHDGEVVLAAFHGQVDVIHQAEGIGSHGGGQGAVVESGDLVVGLAENPGVIGDRRPCP